MYELLYSGFDTLYVAFQGALPVETRRDLAKAKERAKDQNQPALTSIGPGIVDAHVSETGSRGGYAFVCNTGPLGETWLFKDSSDSSNWNIFVNIDAKSLLVAGYHETKRRLFDTLERMGCLVGAHAVNRIDFAMDFLAPGFELDHNLFVTPRGMKVKPYWGEKEPNGKDKVSAVFANRRTQSVTIGSSARRQIIIYDKRRDSLDKHKYYWFQTWGIDPKDRSKEVYRVELRAGKGELKEKYQLSTFDDIEQSVGDVYKTMVEQIRYLAPFQTDSNVSRQELHPIWTKISELVISVMQDSFTGLTRDQVGELDRSTVIEDSVTMLIAYGIRVGVAEGLSNEEIENDLPNLVEKLLSTKSAADRNDTGRRIKRARERMHFIPIGSPNVVHD